MTVRLPALAILFVLATSGVAAAASDDTTLTQDDAIAALREVGVTKTFIAPAPKWGPVVLATSGNRAAEQLVVRVFPSVDLAHEFSKAYPPPPASAFRALGLGPDKFLPRLYACNATVASVQLPFLRTQHPTAKQRYTLATFIAKIRSTQLRLIAILRDRCAA